MRLRHALHGFALLASIAAPAFAAPQQESDLLLCKKDEDCVIVPYHHCCGKTKRAINKAYREEYSHHPEWQKFDGAACATMGVCRNDSNWRGTECRDGVCVVTPGRRR